MEDRGFRAVQVFGLAVAQHPPPKADGASAGVADRENNTIPKFVIGAAGVFPAHQQPGGQGLLKPCFSE